MSRPPESIHIARGEVQLGALPLAEIHALLEAGFLQPTDQYWFAGQTEWLPLTALPVPDESATARVAADAAKAVLGAVESVRQRAAAAVTMASTAAERQKAEIAATTRRLLTDFTPRLRAPMAAALATTSKSVEAALRDEPLLRKVFGAAYDVLPRPVRLFVPEEQFIGFCLEHRARLLSVSDAGKPE